LELIILHHVFFVNSFLPPRLCQVQVGNFFVFPESILILLESFRFFRRSAWCGCAPKRLTACLLHVKAKPHGVALRPALTWSLGQAVSTGQGQPPTASLCLLLFIGIVFLGTAK